MPDDMFEENRRFVLKRLALLAQEVALGSKGVSRSLEDLEVFIERARFLVEREGVYAYDRVNKFQVFDDLLAQTKSLFKTACDKNL